MSASDLRVRIRRRHLPDGTVLVGERSRLVNEGDYQPAIEWTQRDGRFEAVKR